MASTHVHTLAGIERSLIIAQQRCDALRKNIEAVKIEARAHEAFSCKQSRPASSNNSDSTSETTTPTDAEINGTDDRPNCVYGGLPPILPSLLKVPEKNLKSKEATVPKDLESGDQSDGGSTLQKLQDYLLGFPGMHRMGFHPIKTSRPATPFTENCDKEQQTVSESFPESTNRSQSTACDEASFHTDNGCNTKDDFLSADDRPPSSCKQISSRSKDSSPNEPLRKPRNSLPMSAKLKVLKHRVTRSSKLKARARRTDVDRVYSTRLVKTRAGHLKPTRAARLTSADVPGTVKLLARSFSESTTGVRRRPPKMERAILDERHPDAVQRCQVECSPRNVSSGRYPKQPRTPTSRSTGFRVDNSPSTVRARKFHKEPEDTYTNIATTEAICAQNSPPLTTKQFRGDRNECDKGRPDQTKIRQGCSLLDEASSTNQLVGEQPSTFEPKAFCRSHSTTERRRTDINDSSLSIFDVHHSYERPTVSSQLKRVQRRLSAKDIQKEITKRNGHPFVVVTATTPSHNVNLSSRESMGDNARPTRRTNVQQKQSKSEVVLDLKRIASNMTTSTTTLSECGTLSIGGNQHEENFHQLEQEGEQWGRAVEQTLPLRFTRQLRCVLERLRNEIVDLATKRALAASNVPGASFQYPVVTPNTGIMQAKFKWSARTEKKSQDSMNSEETILSLEQLDQKLQAKEDEIYIIVTLCQEVEKMREQLSVLRRRVNLHLVPNSSTGTLTQAQAQPPIQRWFGGCPTSASRASAQKYSRSKSAEFKS